MVPLITTHTPAGTSTYTIFHYMQEYSTGMFRYFWFSQVFFFLFSVMSNKMVIMMVAVLN